MKWIARASGYKLFITADGATMILPEGAADVRAKAPDSIRFKYAGIERNYPKLEVNTIRMRLTASHPWNAAVGLEPTGGVSNYFLGSDPKAWRRDVPQYSRLSIPGVYEGVDLVFYSNRNQLEYDFVVAAGTDPKKIQLAFEGTARLHVDETGDLVLTAAGGSEIHHIRPHVYQQMGRQKIEVAGGYELLDHARASFTLASYDRRKDLIIDPTVSFTDFLSGNSEDIANAIATDTFEGNSYMTGATLSSNFPLSNPLQAREPGSLDAFVTKLAPNGTIVFSTYWEGVASDTANAIAVDSTGIYITGNTLSGDFPGGHNLPANCYSDMFVTKLPLAGNYYVYSFVNGGSSYDSGQGIAVDSNHEAYVTGYTYSADFPKIGPQLWRSNRLRHESVFDRISETFDVPRRLGRRPRIWNRGRWVIFSLDHR